MRRLLAGVFATALLGACGGGGGPTGAASPSPATSPSSAPSPSPVATPRASGLLFAVLEARKAGDYWQTSDTVAITGLDGFARAKTTFVPRKVYGLCNAAQLTQPEARVAAGKVFFADGSGAIRSLDTSGAVENVGSLPLGAQQTLSFAVDPSGGALVGSVLTVPVFQGPLPCKQTGQFVQDVYTVSAGGAATRRYHQTYAENSESDNFIQAVGWDPAGALVTVHTDIGTQNGSLGRKWYGQLAHFAGSIGSAVGGSDCRPQDEVGNSIACISSTEHDAASVRSPDGKVRWSLPGSFYYYVLLSPDASHAAYCANSGCGVAGSDGSVVKFPATFSATGWLSDSILIGLKGNQAAIASPYGEMATWSASAPSNVDDLGFMGQFAGVVQAG